MRPLYQRLQRHGFNGDGRTDRASLQRAIRLALTRTGGHIGPPLQRATRLALTGTDAQTVRPYKGLLVSL